MAPMMSKSDGQERAQRLAKEPEDKLADAKSQGQAQFDSILEMVEALRAAEEDGEGRRDYRRGEEARERVQEDALSVEVRSDWYAPGIGNAKTDQYGDCKPAEYRILLCTGGPACRIVGELDEHCEPTSARLEVQDWFQPWTAFRPIADKAEHARDKYSGYDSEPALLAYARCFWFGE